MAKKDDAQENRLTGFQKNGGGSQMVNGTRQTKKSAKMDNFTAEGENYAAGKQT